MAGGGNRWSGGAQSIGGVVGNPDVRGEALSDAKDGVEFVRMLILLSHGSSFRSVKSQDPIIRSATTSVLMSARE
jgi:hypothetical protein